MPAAKETKPEEATPEAETPAEPAAREADTPTGGADGGTGGNERPPPVESLQAKFSREDYGWCDQCQQKTFLKRNQRVKGMVAGAEFQVRCANFFCATNSMPM